MTVLTSEIRRKLGIIAAALVLGACGSDIRGHAEIGDVGRALELGQIEAATSEQTVHLEVDVTRGNVRVELVGPEGSVWVQAASPANPIRHDVPMPTGAGPWRANLVALEPSISADYRIDTVP